MWRRMTLPVLWRHSVRRGGVGGRREGYRWSAIGWRMQLWKHLRRMMKGRGLVLVVVVGDGRRHGGNNSPLYWRYFAAVTVPTGALRLSAILAEEGPAAVEDTSMVVVRGMYARRLCVHGRLVSVWWGGMGRGKVGH